jgi:multidrug resistance efflux pump
MFDELRDSLRAFSDRLDPDEQRRMTAGMRDALVHAKLGIQELRQAVSETDARLRTEQAELDTVRRRQGYASDIGDAETVAVAERFALQHAERVAMLESKRMVQQQELTLAEREYETMSGELQRILSGLAPRGGANGSTSAEADPVGGAEPPPRRTRADREADADARLAELKRRLGK